MTCWPAINIKIKIGCYSNHTDASFLNVEIMATATVSRGEAFEISFTTTPTKRPPPSIVKNKSRRRVLTKAALQSKQQEAEERRKVSFGNKLSS